MHFCLNTWLIIILCRDSVANLLCIMANLKKFALKKKQQLFA